MSPVWQTQENGLPSIQIKAMIAIRGETVDSVGKSIREKPDRVSDTITRSRRNERIRAKLSKHFNIKHEFLWGTNGGDTNTTVSKRARLQ